MNSRSAIQPISFTAAGLQPADRGAYESMTWRKDPRAKALRLIKLQWIAISTAIIALAIISRLGMIAWPFLNDAGLYAALGRTIARSDVIYRDFYETKLPGAALLASAFWRAFGPHWAGYVLCQLAMAFLAAAALARIARRHIGPRLANLSLRHRLPQLVAGRLHRLPTRNHPGLLRSPRRHGGHRSPQQ